MEGGAAGVAGTAADRSANATGPRTLTLHTARKRSKAALVALSGGDEAASSLTLGAASDSAGLARSSSGASLQGGGGPSLHHPAPPQLREPGQQQQHHSGGVGGGGGGGGAMSILDARTRTPQAQQPGGGGGGGRGGRTAAAAAAAWQVGGWSVDYALDWGVVVVACVVLAASEAAQPRAGYIAKVSLRDSSYPLLPNSVPAWSVPLYSLVLPVVLFCLHGAVRRRPPLEGHHLVLGLMTAVITTAAVTNLIKCPVGRLRPDFNARCWPDGKVVWEKEDEFGGYPLCSGPLASVAEGRKSFPSGHSSWSAAGMCYLTWWLNDLLHPFDGGGHAWRLLAALAPTLGALAVGLSRYYDYWHHPSDVAAGLLLGAVVSWLCYRQQRARLADIDPPTYGSAIIGTGPQAPPPWEPAWHAPAPGGRGAAGDDATPLLYSQQQQQRQDRQDRQGLLPV